MQSNTVRPIMKSVIREDLVALTRDYKAAVVLHQLIYWTKRVHDFDKFLQEEYNRNSECNVAFRYGWIIKTAQDLADETMLGVSRQTMRTVLKNLVNLEVIEEAYLDDNKWDKTTKYRLNLVKLQESLFALGYPLSDFTLAKNLHNSRMLSSQHSEVNFRPPSVKNSANNIDKRLHTEITLSPSPTSCTLKPTQKEEIVFNMLRIFSKIVFQVQEILLYPKRFKQLEYIFDSYFQSNLENREDVCHNPTCLKFLMRETVTFDTLKVTHWCVELSISERKRMNLFLPLGIKPARKIWSLFLHVYNRAVSKEPTRISSVYKSGKNSKQQCYGEKYYG